LAIHHMVLQLSVSLFLPTTVDLRLDWLQPLRRCIVQCLLHEISIVVVVQSNDPQFGSGRWGDGSQQDPNISIERGDGKHIFTPWVLLYHGL
jgi:hypothetical protein